MITRPPGILCRAGPDYPDHIAGKVLYTFDRQPQKASSGASLYAIYIARPDGTFFRYPGLLAWEQVDKVIPDPRKVFPLPSAPLPHVRPRSAAKALQPVATSCQSPTPVARVRERKRVPA